MNLETVRDPENFNSNLAVNDTYKYLGNYKATKQDYLDANKTITALAANPYVPPDPDRPGVWRGLNMDPADVAEFEVGQAFEMGGFNNTPASYSTNKQKALGFAGQSAVKHSVLIKVPELKWGTHIGSFSEYHIEEETLSGGVGTIEDLTWKNRYGDEVSGPGEGHILHVTLSQTEPTPPSH